MNIIQISDDFDLQKIADSGQCFRVRRCEDGFYRFVTGGKVLYIRKISAKRYEISCSKSTWQKIWKVYFDLDRNYGDIREDLKGAHPFIDISMEYGKGIRILRQEPWEMLVTFIISQRKSIPAISQCVEELVKKYGREIVTDREVVYACPTPKALKRLTEEELRACQLGYRAPYVLDAARRVASDLKVNLLEALSDEELLEKLLSIHGVGIKVAGCIALFGYGRMGSAPVDVWIARAIEEDFMGQNIFAQFGEVAGIVQQYVFYLKRSGGE